MNKIYPRLTLIWRWLPAALALFLAACALPEPAAVPVEVTFETPLAEIVGGVRLEPPEHRWDGYGEAVDVHGEVLAIGASEWNPCGHGSAYVYRLLGGEWQEEAQLTPSDRDDFKQAWRFEGHRFGTAVAVGEGIIAVGAPGNSYPAAGEKTSAVYLYEYDGRSWIETARLTPGRLDPDIAQTPLDLSACGRMRPRAFGALVALDGDTVAAGGDGGGLVYVYQRGENGWQEQARLLVPGSPGRELYMASIALLGDTLALSVFYVLPQPEVHPYLGGILTGNAVVYVFERAGDAWQESFRFAPEEQADILFFREVNVGASVALGGDSGQATLLAVGLPGFPDWSGVQDHAGMFGEASDPLPEFPESRRQSGALYLFERAKDGGWRQQATLRPAGWENPPGPGRLFTEIPPTTEEAEGNPDEAGSGYFAFAGFPEPFVFPGHIYSEEPEITFFGATVDVDGNQLAVTAGFANATAVFERQGPDWVYRFSITPSNEKMELWEDSAQVVRISGDSLLLGTPSEFGNSAYVFSLAPLANDQ